MMRTKRPCLNKALTIASLCVLLAACGEQAEKKEQPAALPRAAKVPELSYKLLNTYPHDTTVFTEGFFFHEDKLFESSGAPEYLPQTRSSFGIVDLGKGTLDVKAELDRRVYFGEGIVLLDGKIYQVTYQNQQGFIYDAKTFSRTGQFSYPNKEGWGLTTDGKSLIMSDGTYNLTFFDPADFRIEKTLPVTEAGYGLDHLNELEYINGYIYANVWMTNYIVKIDPATGEVVGKIDLDELSVKSRSRQPRSLEMNGIAYNPSSGTIFVTGKLWPFIYEISFPD
jgi:glutamine cyclotransferase